MANTEAALLLRDLEGEAEVRQVFTGMIGGVSQLRDEKIPRLLLFAAVNRRVKVDEMPAGVARRAQGDRDIALAVERAGVADIAVVVDNGVDIRGLSPADALQMHRERCAGRAPLDIERKHGRLDPEASRLLLGAILDGERVRAAEIVGNGEMEFYTPRRIRHRLRDRS